MEPRTLWTLSFTVLVWASAFPAIRIALDAYWRFSLVNQLVPSPVGSVTQMMTIAAEKNLF